MNDLNDDIARYLSGKMSPSEMHALERKALDDPFLADALEGAVEIAPDDLRHDLSVISSKLDERIKQRSSKQITLWTWPLRIAAGLLLLISATVVIITLRPDKRSDDLALNTQKSAPPAPLADSITGSKEEAEARQQGLEALSNRDDQPAKTSAAPQSTERSRDTSTASRAANAASGASIAKPETARLT